MVWLRLQLNCHYNLYGFSCPISWDKASKSHFTLGERQGVVVWLGVSEWLFDWQLGCATLCGCAWFAGLLGLRSDVSSLRSQLELRLKNNLIQMLSHRGQAAKADQTKPTFPLLIWRTKNPYALSYSESEKWNHPSSSLFPKFLREMETLKEKNNYKGLLHNSQL